jgi:hypothetical protein
VRILCSKLILPAALLIGGCHANVKPEPCYGVNWAKEPLQPALHFDHPGPAGVVTILLLDAHSGGILPGAQVALGGTPRMARTDSTGTAILRDVPPGRYEIWARHIGYSPRKDSLILALGEGRTRIVQLQRDVVCLQEAISAD